jgi:hypothetical protein
MMLVLVTAWIAPGSASDDDIQVDTTADTNASSATDTLSLSLTVGSNTNRYLAIGVTLASDTTGLTVMPEVETATWTVGGTVQNFTVRGNQQSTTGDVDSTRATIFQLVAPTTGNGTVDITLDARNESETADSSPTGSTAVTGEDEGQADGTTTLSGNLDNTPVVRETVSITVDSVTAEDDGDGSLTGTGVSSGTVNYDTGAWSITYTSAPTNGEDISADYSYGKWEFSGTLDEPEVVKSSVTFTATVGGSSITATDDGDGALSGDGGNITGTFNYSTGGWQLQYLTPPDDNTSITVVYDHQNTAQLVMGAVSLYNVNQTTPSPGVAGNADSDNDAEASVSGEERDLLFGVVATTGPAGTLTADTTLTASMQERWKQKNGTGNGDAFGAGATATNTNDVSQNMRWNLGSSREWAMVLIDIQPPNDPTEARFTKARASITAAGTLIRWRTASELRNLGFKLYREDEHGELIQLNASLVAGSALFAGADTHLTAGRSYAFWDPTGREAGHRYWVEAIDLDGTSQWHGPVLSEPDDMATPLLPNQHVRRQLTVSRASSPTISDLSRLHGNHSAHRVAALSAADVRSPLGRAGAEARQWHLAANDAGKIVIDRDGWVRVTRDQLAAAGYDPGPNAGELRVTNRGRQIPVAFTGLEDGRLDPDDAIEFFALAMDTSSTDENVYWLHRDVGSPRAVEKIDAPAASEPVALFPATVERRDRSVYVAALTNTGDRGNFYGPIVSEEMVTQDLQVDALTDDRLQAAPVTLRLAVQGITDVDHAMSVRLNGEVLPDLQFVGSEHHVREYVIDPLWIRKGKNTVALRSENGSTDLVAVDSVRLTWQRPYEAVDDVLWMSAPAGATVEVKGFSGPDVRILDVTDPFNPVQLLGSVSESSEGPTWSATASAAEGQGVRTLLAVHESRLIAPSSVQANTPSSWFSEDHSAEMVIITHQNLSAAARQLAAYRSANGVPTEVVSVENIYDEHSWGIKDTAAIRRFLSRANAVWDDPPRYVLLLGDASFDPRNHLGFGDRDLVPTKLIATNQLMTANDDLLADLNADGFAEMAVGRLPAATPAQAETMVNKILDYEDAEGGPWSRRVSLISGEVTEGFDFDQATSALAEVIPETLTVDRVNLNDGFDPARQAIIEAFNQGRLVVNYLGHGSQSVWKNDDLFANEDAAALSNGERLPLVVAMSCLNGFFHDLYQDSLAESLLLNPNGGAVAVWASSALTDPSGQDLLNRTATMRLFDSSAPSLGDVVLDAKATATDRDIRNTWILFGDPSMKLRH